MSNYFGFALLVACATPVDGLRVDIGRADTADSTADVQSGFVDLSAANRRAQRMGRATQSRSQSIPTPLGKQNAVSVSLEATDSRFPTLAFRDRGDMRGAWGDLAEDFVFNEAALTLTLEDLKPGVYALKTWHHDPQYEGGKVDIYVNGALVVGGLPQTTGLSREPASASFSFVATGVDPVTIDFVSQSKNDAFVAYLNGFSLSRAHPVAAFDIDRPDRAATQAWGGVGDRPYVSARANGSPIRAKDHGIRMTVQGAGDSEVFDHGGRTRLSGHAFASLLRDGVRISGSPPPCAVTITGLQPVTHYLLTWYAYDAAVEVGHPMFVYQDQVTRERLKFTNVNQFSYTKANVLEREARPEHAAHTFLSKSDTRGEIRLTAGRGGTVGSDDPKDGPVDTLFNGMTISSIQGLPADWLAAFQRLPAVIQHSAVNPSGDSLTKNYSEEVELIPPTEPEDAEFTFEVEPGFRVELVAAEPLIADPVGLSFDERGRLFVAEMRGYNQGNLVPSSEARRLAVEDEPLGGVRLLEDVDGDGRFDKSTIYVDGLVWPNGVFAYDGGVFVAAAPDLLYCKDTDGDGVADIRKVVLTGFGYSNWQHLPNSFRWGLDNRIHGASGSGGGLIRYVERPEASPVQIRGRDFSFDPKRLELEPTNTSAQFGLSFDDWGNKFLTSNSDHILLVYFEDRYIVRNPLVAPRSWRLIAAEGRGADVYRISPPEPHRVVWMRMRASGVIQGIIERGGAPTGYITAASGTTIYRGDAWPAAYRGDSFTAECSGNLIHRNVLEPDGVGRIARRADPHREFLASRDIWFRPVNMVNGPDGNLYIADMYRQVINEGVVLPPTLRKCFDLTEGCRRGRIYRVVPEGFQQTPVPDLGRSTTEQLVLSLQRQNAWHRITASRLLFERQDPDAVDPLNQLAVNSPSPLGRMHALYALDGQQALSPDIVLRALADEHPRCREHAVRLSESVLNDSAPVRRRLFAMTEEEEVRIRYQLAFTLGEIPGMEATQALAKLGVRDAEDTWFRLAILSSSNGRSGNLFAEITARAPQPLDSGPLALLAQLAEQVGLHGRSDQIERIEETLGRLIAEEKPLARSIVRSLVSGLEKSGRPMHSQLLSRSDSNIGRIFSEMLHESIQLAGDDRAETKRRESAIQFLSLGSYQRVAPALSPLVDCRQPHAVAQAALETLGRFSQPQVARTAIDAWPSLTPQLRSAAADAIFARRDRLPILLSAIEDGAVRASQLDPARIQFLTAHPDPAIREQAGRLLNEQTTSRREEVIAAYRDVHTMDGDIRRGREVFRRVLHKCHRLEGFGHDLGLPLNAMQDRGKEAVLRNVLDPNQNINPQYVNYVVVTEEGRVMTGMIVAETANSITLERGEGESDTVLRNAIDELVDTGMSIMPEGLEKDLTPRDMADLLFYLEAVQ